MRIVAVDAAARDCNRLGRTRVQSWMGAAKSSAYDPADFFNGRAV
jgi:hypothetical protein